MALAQLCHESTTLTHAVWIELFPRIWAAISERQRQVRILQYQYKF